MHPAFSVIFFTTLSGLGYGLWFWTGLGLLLGAGRGEQAGTMSLVALLLGFVLVSTGLLSSTLHLGKPLRSWRAFSQWRTSWLSREGVLAIACFVPFLGVIAPLALPLPAAIAAIALFALVPLSLATVACTAMIYASLKTIPAWSHRLVVPGYLLFALLTGGLLCLSMLSVAAEIPAMAGIAVLIAASALGALKLSYWRDVDRGEMPTTRASALGLPANRTVRDFERPHTEANYLTREMGFVVARKHARKLRFIALVLFAGVPLLVGLLLAAAPSQSGSLLWLASLSALAGAMFERWLFFAEAKHVVMTYY